MPACHLFSRRIARRAGGRKAAGAQGDNIIPDAELRAGQALTAEPCTRHISGQSEQLSEVRPCGSHRNRRRCGVFSSFITFSQNFRPFGCSIQSPSTCFSPPTSSASATYTALLRPSPIHPERVEEDDGISGIERRFRHSRTSSRTASVTRLIRSGETSDAIKLLQVALNLAHPHAAGVKTDDPVVDPSLALRGTNCGSKLPWRPPRKLDLQGAFVRPKRLLGVAVANVPGSVAGWITLLVSQVRRQLGP
jgi:hypothetical protein